MTFSSGRSEMFLSLCFLPDGSRTSVPVGPGTVTTPGAMNADKKSFTNDTGAGKRLRCVTVSLMFLQGYFYTPPNTHQHPPI